MISGKGHRPKMTIYKQVSDKCLYVSNSGIPSIVCVIATDYTSLCRGLLKVRYNILVDPNGGGFLISSTVFFLLLWYGNTALCLKNISQIFTHLVNQ